MEVYMSKNRKKPLLFWILGGSFAIVSGGLGVAYGISSNYTDVINMALNLRDQSTLEVTTKSEDEDTEYFKSSYAVRDENGKIKTIEKNGKVENLYDSEKLISADEEIAEKITEEGSVLLKNENNALPLSKTAKVTLLGHSSCNTLVCGTGSADISADGAPNLKESLENRGVSVNSTVWDYYQNLVDTNQYQTNPKKGDNSIRGGNGSVKGEYTVNEVPWDTLTSQAGVTDSFNNYNDAAIIVVSRLGGEMYDIPSSTEHQGNASETVNGSGNSLELTINELELINQAKANFNKVIVLINSTNPLECDFLTSGDSKVDACLWIGYTGKMGLSGVADVLVGNENPSGRLYDTYCNDNTTSPAMKNFYSEEWSNSTDAKYKDDMTGTEGGGLDGNRWFNAYEEGIYVGYRYYETRYEDYVYQKNGVGEYNYSSDVAYPFGYGLSYTTFSYSTPEFKVNDDKDTIDVTVTVTNSGSVAGKDVVEVYFQSEYTSYDVTNKIEKSAVELCGFTKTNVIEPGKSEKVTISVDRSEFATYDTYGKQTYILDAGNYYVSVGHDAHDALNNIIAKKGSGANQNLITSVGTSSKGDASFVYSFNIDSIDDEKYAYGKDGKKITNQLQSAELSYYGMDNMTYLSRNDWTGTFPEKVEIALNDNMFNEITGIKQYEKTTIEGETLPKMGQQNGKTLAQMMGKEYNDSEWDELLDQLSYKEMCTLVGIGYHGTQAVESVAKPSASDENGPQGFTQKLTNITGDAKTMCAYTDENMMAATWNIDLMEEVGEHIGEDGLALGLDGLYGPAMNTHRTAYGGRNFEYYSEDGFLAGKIAAAEVKGIQSKGVYVFIKHFALNDEETNCRSISTFANEQSIREIYLKPFQLAVTEGGAHNVMTAFSRVGVIWSSAHSGLMTNILRNEWGMDGFAVSDYTTTSTGTTKHSRGTYDPYLAVIAGTDTFDSSDKKSQANYLLTLDYENDPHMVNALRQACHRILYIVGNSAAMNGVSKGTKIINVLVWWQFAIIDGIIYFGIAAIVMIILATIKQIKYCQALKLSKGTEDEEDSSEKKGENE